MSSIELTVAVLAASAAPLVKAAYEALKEQRQQEEETDVQIKVGDETLSIQSSEEISTELVDSLQKAVDITGKVSDDPISFTRKAVSSKGSSPFKQGKESPVESSEKQNLTTIGIAFNSDEVFRDARKRNDFVFKLNITILIVLVAILFIGLGGAIISAVFLGNSIWVAVFGGATVIDIIGFLAFKPATAIRVALISTQQLDTLYLRLQSQLKSCDGYTKLEDMIQCKTDIWEVIWRDLAALQKIV